MTISNQSKNKYKYKVKLDIKQDADNWYTGCTRASLHGIDFTERAPKEIIEKIRGMNEKEAFKFLIPYLKEKYITEKDEIDKYITYVKNEYSQKFNKGCQKVVNILGKPIYRNDFTTFISTFPRGPYNYEHGYTWQPVGWLDPIRGFLHELMHFQFIHYYRNNPDSAVSKLSNEQFEYLKESLTIILNKDFVPLISMSDKGYEKHKNFRQELKLFWESNKNFDELVEFGLKRIPHYVPSSKK